MDEIRKRAYRYLLYWAMLEIRPLAWTRLGALLRINPLRWGETASRIRRAGAIADWLHNLAVLSAHEFERFDEQQFWQDYEVFNRRHPDYRLSDLKRLFDRLLAGRTGPPYGG